MDRPPLTSSNILEEHAGGFGIRAGKSVVVDPPDGTIPYQPWALTERDRRRRPENSYEDNEGKCILSGMPRIMLFSFRMVYLPDTVLFLSDYIGASDITTDFKEVYSVAGDVLTVEKTQATGGVSSTLTAVYDKMPP